jgi:hypothetical protein
VNTARPAHRCVDDPPAMGEPNQGTLGEQERFDIPMSFPEAPTADNLHDRVRGRDGR